MVQNVYIGMSGGVDSSVAAALLKEQGYNVVGVFMKNWSQDLPGMPCTWKQDYQDAKRVAVQLGIEFKMYDFETEYREKVVNYMVDEYQAGRTPNPDVMCNQEIKFKLFLQTALGDGADLIATGHYARVSRGQLRTAANKAKDQTYFLYRISEQALNKTLFPIGTFETKDQVRLLAKKLRLATAEKKDSQGICFVGKVGIKEFLLNELGPQEEGAIINSSGKEIGKHDGAIFYTIGQRHGLDVGGGLPYYVMGKDMSKNQVFVSSDLQAERLWQDTIQLTHLHWINNMPDYSQNYLMRTRYREPLVEAALQPVSTKVNATQNMLKIALSEPVRAITPGQSVVMYEGDHVIGGGIIV